MNKVNWKNGIIFLGLVVGMLAVDSRAIAQDSEVTDEELLKYATVMNQIDVLKADLKAKTNEMVKGNELMNGGRRYKELKGANGDETKLSEIEATEEEIAAFNTIEETIATMKGEFKTNYTALIKDDLGAATFNKVKKALKADDELKAKYEEVLASISEEPTDEEEEDSNGEN